MRPLIQTFYPFFKPYMRRLALAMFGMGVFILLVLIPPLLTRHLIDRVVVPGAWEQLPWVVLAMALAPIAAHTLRYFNINLILLMSTRLIADLRVAMYRKILALSMRYHGENQSGKITGRIMDDVSMVQRLLTGESVRMLMDAIIVVFCLWVMLSISTKLTLLVFVLMICYVLAYRFFSRRIRVATRAHRRIFDQIGGRLQETVAGVRQVRIYNREEWENTVFLGRMAGSLGREMESAMGQMNLSVACQAISGLGTTAIVGVAMFMALNPQTGMTYGNLAAFSMYTWTLIDPVVRLTNMAGQLVETLVSLERIASVLREPTDVADPPRPVRPDSVRGTIEFKDVVFSYAPDKPLYRGLSLKVNPGAMVALVGETGCGKTSLTSLLMRYWDVQGGSVRLDGRDIRELDLHWFRQLFGVVLQDPVIFDATLAENIAYGRPRASREAVEGAARAAEIYELAMALPDGFDTMIGAQGVKLSVGERQRVSIARAILKDPVILVLDEATSSLDSQSEALIQKALATALKGRTGFVVAHRLSTIEKADMIVVMDRGRIIEQGTHRDLLALQGKYFRLHREWNREAEGARS